MEKQPPTLDYSIVTQVMLLRLEGEPTDFGTGDGEAK